jgi:hypothetical protein
MTDREPEIRKLYIECGLCSMNDHLTVFEFYNFYDEDGPMVDIFTALDFRRGFFQRLLGALRYLFCPGIYTDSSFSWTSISVKDAKRIRDFMDAYVQEVTEFQSSNTS